MATVISTIISLQLSLILIILLTTLFFNDQTRKTRDPQQGWWCQVFRGKEGLELDEIVNCDLHLIFIPAEEVLSNNY